MSVMPSEATRRITQTELESYLWGAATLLRGLIDAGDYKQYIFPLLFFKRVCDVFDEEYQDALAESGGDESYARLVEHRFLIPDGVHWKDIREVSANLGQAIQASFRTIESANGSLLAGIFGDAIWTNKERLSDATLRDLIEHFSSLTLSLANVPEDELGVAYEFLIKKFADDSGHTAAEFYTNRTVVHLMTLMLEPQPGESVYDPTCGSGGMLLSTAVELKRQGKEWRNLKMFGQERNLLTSAIARMNLFLHGFEDFRIMRGDTLSEPKLLQGDRLQQFDLILANPPYSIKAWNRKAWESDAYGRKIWGVPPQGRADYAFWQHIVASMHPETGRCAILFPHGVLFRDEEKAMREVAVRSDVVECVLGLGPNLFYNSPMEACVVICRAKKPASRKGKILFIDAKNEVTRERAQSFLTASHIQKIATAFKNFSDDDGFARAVHQDEIERNAFNLNLPLYVKAKVVPEAEGTGGLSDAISAWRKSSRDLRESMTGLIEMFTRPAEPSASQPATELGQDAREWMRQFPLAEMAKRDFLPRYENPYEQYVGLLRYLNIRSHNEWRGVAGVAHGFFRHTASFESKDAALAVWLRQGEAQAERIACASYDAAKFEKVLVEVRSLTCESAETFLPKLREMCAACGVAVAYVPAIDGVRVSGYTCWLSDTKALLQISDRYKRADTFWFTFYHEAGHIVKHKGQQFAEGYAREPDQKEREADEFARDSLIPPDKYKIMAAERPRTYAQINRWAHHLGVAPGIVVGRLQNDGLLPRSYCNDLKAPLDWRE